MGGEVRRVQADERLLRQVTQAEEIISRDWLEEEEEWEKIGQGWW